MTSFVDKYGNVSRVIGVYESSNGIIVKLDNLLSPPMPADSTLQVSTQLNNLAV